MKLSVLIGGVALSFFFFFPFTALHAQVDCPPGKDLADCIADFQSKTGESAGFNVEGEAASFPAYLNTVIRAAFAMIGAIFFAYMFYGGYLWFTAGGNDQQVEKAQSAIRHAIIGVVVTIGAFAITNFVLTQLVT